MLRIVACLCIAVLFCSCEKNWRRLHIEKRVYRNGYYVHVPWERRAPVNAYPDTAPFPVGYSRTTQTDTTRKYVGGVTNDSTTSSTAATAPPVFPPAGNRPASGGNGIGGNGTAPPTTGNNGGGAGPVPASGTPAPAPVPVATYQPAPPLQQVPNAPEPPLSGPPVPPVAPPDSAVVQNDSIAPPVDSVAQRSFKFPEGEFSLVAELGFYNPVYTSGIAIKPFSYNSGMSLRYTIHPWSRHKLSLEGGVFASGLFIAQDQHKRAPMFVERHGKERILQFKTRFLFMDHVYVNRKPDAKFDAVEVGLFSDIGLFSTHVAVDYRGADSKAALTRSKTRLFGLHYLRTLQYGMTVRVAGEAWSVFANYRFNALVSAVPDGGNLPHLVLGATFAFQ